MTRFRITITLALFAALATTASADMQAALFDELVPLFPDSAAADGQPQWQSDAPRGVPIAVHALIAGLEPNAPLQWSLTEDGAPVAAARAYRMIDVPVEQNVGLTGWTEILTGEENPHVIRDAPFRVYEALMPIDANATAGATGGAALRIELLIESDAAVGERDYVLAIASGEATVRLRWNVRIWPVVVPPPSPQSPGYTNWYSLGHLEHRHDVKRWSEPFWAMLGEYANMMRRGRQNTFLLPWRALLTKEANGTFSLDQARLRRYVQLFLDRGFCRIEGGHLAGRHGSDWETPRFDVLLTGRDVTSIEGRADVRAITAQMRAGVAALNLPAHVTYLQHLADEPIDENAAAYRSLSEQVRAAWPGVRIFDAAMSQEVAGHIDVWCVQAHHYQEHRQQLETRQELGEGVWIYTCLTPGGPWLNRLLDQERVRCVYLHWSLIANDLDGFLHWGLNFFRRGVDPYEQSVVPHGGEKRFLPAGDPHVLYPTPEGPISGQRFEAHRIGAEDVELLRLLKQRDADAAAAIIKRVFRTYDDWEPDAANFRAARRALLEALSQSQP